MQEPRTAAAPDAPQPAAPSASPPAAPSASPPAASASGQEPPSPASWPRRIELATGWLTARLARPRFRLALGGAALLLTGALIVVNSVWTLPLVIGGSVMVVVGWIGSRLDGQLLVEWGGEGTQVQFRAKIAPSPPAPLLGAPAPSAPAATPEPARLGAGAPPPQLPAASSDVLDGEAHTVEVEVAELEALIAAAEREGAHPARKLAPRACSGLDGD
jgi:hypothetical protein